MDVSPDGLRVFLQILRQLTLEVPAEASGEFSQLGSGVTKPVIVDAVVGSYVGFFHIFFLRFCSASASRVMYRFLFLPFGRRLGIPLLQIPSKFS